MFLYFYLKWKWFFVVIYCVSLGIKKRSIAFAMIRENIKLREGTRSSFRHESCIWECMSVRWPWMHVSMGRVAAVVAVMQRSVQSIHIHVLQLTLGRVQCLHATAIIIASTLWNVVLCARCQAWHDFDSANDIWLCSTQM